MAKWQIITINLQDKHDYVDLNTAIIEKLNDAEKKGNTVEFVQELKLPNKPTVLALFLRTKDSE